MVLPLEVNPEMVPRSPKADLEAPALTPEPPEAMAWWAPMEPELDWGGRLDLEPLLVSSFGSRDDTRPRRPRRGGAREVEGADGGVGLSVPCLCSGVVECGGGGGEELAGERLSILRKEKEKKKKKKKEKKVGGKGGGEEETRRRRRRT